MLRPKFVCLSLFGLALVISSNAALGQYQLTVLDSNQEGQSVQPPDPLLVNAWGLTRGPSTPWWIADNMSGWSTLYDKNGVKQGLDVEIPPAPSGGPVGQPTGVVWNPSQTGEFKVRGWQTFFIFATLDGTISAWAPGLAKFDTEIAVDSSSKGASYTALAVTNKQSRNFLFAADNANNHVDIFDGTFTFKGHFAPDPAIPAGFSVFGIRDIDGLVFVSFASSAGNSGGFIDIYSEAGVLLSSSIIHGAPLNQPWGFAAAPNNFGPLSNALLISNNTNSGTINAFNLLTKQFVGTVKDTSGDVIHIDQLWAIDFGGGGSTPSGSTNTLFFTAGPDNNLVGEFGKIIFK
jgi:uncharacterized protein (TIGR03118 family)